MPESGFVVFLRVLAVLTLALAPTAVSAAANNPSGLPLPRFVTIRAKESNVRVGPGYQYDIAWTYQVGGIPVEIIQENNYPWEGDLKFTITPRSSMSFSLLIRIPGWARNEALPSGLYRFQTPTEPAVSIKINGAEVDYNMENGYAVLNRIWRKNDVVEVSLPMQVRRVIASDKLEEDAGKVTLQRGPVVFCAEWADNQGRVTNLVLPRERALTAEFKPDLLNGVMVLRGEAIAVQTDEKANRVTTVTQPFTAIPYYAWANRGRGEMTVWIPEQIRDIQIISH